MCPVMVAPSRTNLITQQDLSDTARVDLSLTVENGNEVFNETACCGTGDSKERPVEYFDLLVEIG